MIQAAELAKVLYHEAINNGGVTVDVTGNQPTECWVIGGVTESLVFESNPLTPTIDTVTIENWLEFNYTPGACYGSWAFKGEIHIDVVTVIHDSPSTFTGELDLNTVLIREIARARGELAFGYIDSGYEFHEYQTFVR